MITKVNFKTLLETLSFNANTENSIFTKIINGYELKVDFTDEKLIYPEGLVVNELQTSNFFAPENFVVFECVHRLLEKGYPAERIELEKRWSLGHSQKSGRADISVFKEDENGNISLFMIIECKTAGAEYNKAINILKEDGGQLFSYWQQDRGVECLALYASDFENGEISYKNAIIRCRDDANLIKLSQKDESIKLYQKASNAKQLHDVWLETYGAQLTDNLIFSDDVKAYNLDLPPLRKKDLKNFSPDDKIINQFEEILRHNAVSDKENAFNRLIALFICKLVDEQKDDNAEVEFQYKVGIDTYETLQDRLQKLYQIGMKKFMKEEIFYVSNDYAKDLFQNLDADTRANAITDLEQTIRKLKFYTNNDFSFKDVHNEELFLQNGKILMEMVQLFEKYRISYTSKHQFLGDMFEQLLNKGFKQNEGQFFTPMPITRFIWDALPMQTILTKKSGDYPKVIDYACGSGHFLIEAVEAINSARPAENNDWVSESIFGIEKDYRLARVSQVSMFMNGAGKANIIFGDGLDNEKGIKNENFDILVANPPYSVAAFKSHLKLRNNDLALLENISNNGGEIEVLFCERIAQLLNSGGVGAVILPSSILSNDSGSYITARQLLLNEFRFRAIVQLGSKTFGATGTNTVVLFLEKIPYPPKQNRLAMDTALAIFAEKTIKQNYDVQILNAYLVQIGVPSELYEKLRLKQFTWDEMQDENNEYIVAYRNEVLNKITLSKTEEKERPELADRQALKMRKFFEKFSNIEQEKIALFALLYRQKTLVITAPSDNAKQKEFLGYDWSNRKGAEGIQIQNAGGKLYNDKDRFASNTLAACVRDSFSGSPIIGEEQKEYATILNTVDMLDFNAIQFNYAIRTSIQKKVEVVSKYDLVRLNTVSNIYRGVTYSKNDQSNIETSKIILPADNITLGGQFELNKKIYLHENKILDDEKRLKVNDIFICFSSGSEKHVGKLCLIEKDTNYYAGGFMGILRTNEKVKAKYLYNLLNQENMRNIVRQSSTGSNIKNLSNAISEIKIPLPPLDIQQKIIEECEKIDQEYENSRMKIEEYRAKIAKIFNDLEIVQRGG